MKPFPQHELCGRLIRWPQIAGHVFHRLMLFLLMLGCLCINDASLLAQDPVDEVTLLRPKSPGTMKRKGRIVEWKGASITIDLGDRQVEADNERIIDVKTQWPAAYPQAKQLAAQGKSKEAIDQYVVAIEAESRAWAQRIMRSELVGQLALSGQIDEAALHYAEILSEDRNSRFTYLVPLAWTTSTYRFGRANDWLDAKASIIQLLGASWLLETPSRAKAIERLEKLAGDIDPRVSRLAMAQLWRTRTVVNEKQIQRWQEMVEEMPPEYRAGPRLVLGRLQARAGASEDALFGWMKVVTLNQDQPALVSASLFLSSKLLLSESSQAAQGDAGQQKKQQAMTLLGELKSRYPNSFWAQQSSSLNADQRP